MRHGRYCRTVKGFSVPLLCKKIPSVILSHSEPQCADGSGSDSPALLCASDTAVPGHNVYPRYCQQSSEIPMEWGPFSFSCVNAVFHSAWQPPQAGQFNQAKLSLKPSQSPEKCCKVLIQLPWVVSSSVPRNYRTLLSLDKNCSHFDTCCQGCKRQQAIAAKMPRSWEVCRVTVLLKAIDCVQLPWY